MIGSLKDASPSILTFSKNWKTRKKHKGQLPHAMTLSPKTHRHQNLTYIAEKWWLEFGEKPIFSGPSLNFEGVDNSTLFREKMNEHDPNLLLVKGVSNFQTSLKKVLVIYITGYLQPWFRAYTPLQRESHFWNDHAQFLPRWWFQRFWIFSKILGEKIPILTSIFFKGGWFNHQLL